MDLLDAHAQSSVSADEANGRVYGWLPGVVTDVDRDTYYVKARIAAQGDNESSEWLVPMGIGAAEAVPKVGDPVGVSFMDGDPHRGAYFYFPQSTTKNRPKEAMMLGATFVGMFNYLVSSVRQLRDDFVDHVHTGPSTTCANGAAWTGSTAAPTGGTTAVVPQKAKAADGSVVADKSSSEIVLSGDAVVR